MQLFIVLNGLLFAIIKLNAHNKEQQGVIVLTEVEQEVLIQKDLSG